MLVYIDDIAVSSPNGHYIVSFKELLNNNFKITDLGELQFMLGIHIFTSHKIDTISLFILTSQHIS